MSSRITMPRLASVALVCGSLWGCSGDVGGEDPDGATADDAATGDDTGSAGSLDSGAGAADSGRLDGASPTDSAPGVPDGATTTDSGTTPGADSGLPPAPDSGPPASDVLKGYWVWEKRVAGTETITGEVNKGQQKLAFGTGNNKCHYIWNEITGSDFHTECTYSITKDMVTFTAKADPDGTAAGWSCAHPDWTSWNDRPAVEYGRYKFVGDRLWIGVNAYWGFGGGCKLSDGKVVPTNNSLKRFPFWESKGQAEAEEAWIVFKPVTRAEWYGKYAISTTCQGTAEVCKAWPGCGAGDKKYVD